MCKASQKELEKFDITMSGTSATVMLQTPKKAYIAWVGDCYAVLGKKDRKLTTTKITQEHIEHTPLNEREKRRIFAKKAEVKTGFILAGEKKPRIYVRGR